MNATEWLKHNWPWLAPIATLVLVNLANGLTNYPQAQSWIHTIIDTLSFLTKSNSPGTLKMPIFARSKNPHKMEMPQPGKAAMLLPFLLLAGVGTLSSCACWTPEHRGDPACVVLHQIIDCSVDAIKDLAPAVVGVISSYVGGSASPDWDGLLQRLEGMGIRDGGCILAQLENDFLSKAQASPAHAAKVKAVQDTLGMFKAHFKIQGVKFCWAKDGQKVCR